MAILRTRTAPAPVRRPRDIVRGVCAAAGLAVVILAGAPAAGHAQAGPECTFVLGFATLRNQVGPATVGDCQENQRFVPNGNAEQLTSGGLLVWRKADNWTAFTD